jgi:hypothetical protein
MCTSTRGIVHADRATQATLATRLCEEQNGQIRHAARFAEGKRKEGGQKGWPALSKSCR